MEKRRDPMLPVEDVRTIEPSGPAIRPESGGAMATDPVCGMEVYKREAAAEMQYEGVTYYFCSNSCFGRFADAPKIYVSAAA